jgi:hypothetical protein
MVINFAGSSTHCTVNCICEVVLYVEVREMMYVFGDCRLYNREGFVRLQVLYSVLCCLYFSVLNMMLKLLYCTGYWTKYSTWSEE